jgi:TonB family protein
MSLNTMILKGMENYGAVELHKNANKFAIKGYLYALAFFVLLFLINLGIGMLGKEEEKRIPRVRIKSLADLAPPPSTQDDAPEPMAMAAPSAADIAKPTFGIPVPVPDAVAPDVVMPDLNNLPVNTGTEGIGSGGIDAGGISSEPAVIEEKKPVVEEEPNRDDFVSVEVEPAPIVNIQTLVEYPEVAKRAGLEGKVIVSALIDKDGKVIKVEIDKSDYPVFEEAARKAMFKARFTPARQNGEPVKLWYTLPIVFKLSGN